MIVIRIKKVESIFNDWRYWSCYINQWRTRTGTSMSNKWTSSRIGCVKWHLLPTLSHCPWSATSPSSPSSKRTCPYLDLEPWTPWRSSRIYQKVSRINTSSCSTTISTSMAFSTSFSPAKLKKSPLSFSEISRKMRSTMLGKAFN